MKKLLLSSIVAFSLLGNSLYALDTNATSKNVSKNALEVAKSKANKQKNDTKIIKEAVDSIQLVAKTIDNINKNKNDEAIKSLEKAIGKIEIILSNPKAPALIPIDSKVIVAEYLDTSRSAENAIITSIALLENKRIQEARKIILSLVDEVDFTTISLPLSSYPSALKLAAKKLQENKPQKAKNILINTLNTFVSIKTVSPIGILEAQDLIVAASKVAKNDKKLALSHLSAAKMALKKSEVLGYVSSSSTTYKKLAEQIEKVQKEIKGKNKAEKLFNSLINSIKEFKNNALKTLKK